MTSGKVANISPNIMMNNKTSSPSDDKSYGFLDVMNKNVARSETDVNASVKQSEPTKASDNKAYEKADAKATDKSDNTKAVNDKNTDKTQDKINDKAADVDKTKDNAVSEAKDAKTNDIKTTDAPKEVPDDAVDISMIPAEVIELVNEVINNFSADVKDVLISALDITEDELNSIMSDMNITFVDLMNPKQLTELMVEVADVEDSVSLVLNENLSDALSQIRELSAQVVTDTGLEAPVIKEVVASTGSGIEIPKAMVNQDAEPIKVQDIPDVQIQDIQPKQEAVDRPVVNVTDKQVTPIITDEEPVAEEVADEEAPVIVNKATDNASDNKAVSQDVNEETDNTFTIRQNTSAHTDSGSNLTRQGHSDDASRQFNMNMTVDNQNVQTEAQAPVTEARPTFSRFETMQLITQISEAARLNLSEETTSLEMILNPESLGKIYLNVSQKQGALHAQLMAQNEAVKEALESQMAELRENLNKAGIKVEAVEVSVGTHEFERNLEEGMHQQEEQARQQEEQASKSRRTVSINLNNLDELQGLMSEEDMLVAQMMRDQGNSMNLQA